MKFSTVKKYRRKHRVLGSLLLKNPVLVMGLDLPFVIATSTGLRSAAAVIIQMFIIHMVTVTAGIITCRKLPLWQRIMVNAAISTLAMMAARQLVILLFQGVSGTLGMYLYLMSVNAMTMLQSSTISKKARLWHVVSGAFLNALGFSLVVAVVALLREFFGNGTLWGIQLPMAFKMGGLLLPFGGFIVMAFVLAAAKFINKKLLYFAMVETARKEAGYTKIRVVSEEIL